MLYEETEKEEIERVYAVFADYIRESPYLEWLWSDKLGYLLLKISTEYRQVEEEILVDTADQLARVLFSEAATDVLQMTENEHTEQTADPLELAEIKRRWKPYIDQLPEYAEDGNMTFQEYAERWLARQVRYAPGTLESYRRMLERVYPFIGAIPISRLRPIALENMLAELRKRKYRGKPIGEATVQKYLTVVSSVLTDAKRNEIIQKNPARMIDLPLTHRTTQYIPSPAEIQKLMNALAKEPRHYRMFYLLSMCTGCRRGELCALKWEDFNCSRGGLLLTISRSRSIVPGKGVVEGPTKNGRSREIVLSSDIRGIFLSYRQRKQLEARQARRKMSPYLFTNEYGQLIHPDTFTKRLRKIYASIGLPKEYHLHTLRHYYVTSLLHSGVDKQTVAELVGHADTGFLERTYCHPQQEQKEQAAGAMRSMLRPEGEALFNLAAACPAKSRSA